jgi:type I restriction enzyme S subunit
MRKDWTECLLGDVVTIQTGKYDANHAKPNGKYRFYTCAFEHFMCDTNRFSGKSIILPGNGANVGEVFYYEGEFDAYQRTYVLNDLKLNPKYIFYHLKGFWKSENLDKQFGTATNYIRMGNFTDYSLSFPPFPEQRAIVAKIEELFSDLDKGIADLKKAQGQLMVYRQAVLKKAFEGELTKEWREQQTDLPTAEELLEQIKEERQKHYEQQLENWKQELKAWEENGKEAKKPTKPKKLIPYPTINQLGELPILNLGELVFQISRKLMPQEAPNLPFIGMDCLNKNALKPHFTYTFKEFKSAGNWFNENHVLYGRLRPYLNKVYQAEYEGVASGEFIILETIDSIYSNYLKLIIHQQDFVRWSNNQSSGDKPRVKFDQIALYQIKVPSKIEQLQIVQEIESRLSVCDNVGESITESLEKAKALRQSILKKAFEGTLLSVEEIVACKAAKDYEPASVLLEKIKAEKKK